jgi:hypothetical protein
MSWLDAFIEGSTTDFLLTKKAKGGLRIRGYDASVAVTNAVNIDILCNVPSGAKILGAQIWVTAALKTGETWDADYQGGCSTEICNNQAVAVDTNVNLLYKENGVDAITTGTTIVRVQKNSNPGTDKFTAQGAFYGVVYAEVLDT